MGQRICALQMAFLPYLLPPVRQFLDSLSDRGYDVTLVKSYVRDRSKTEEDRPKLRNHMLRLVCRALPGNALFKPLVFLEFIVRSTWAALRARPHVVVAIDVDTLLQGWVVARLTGARLIYYSVELYTERPGFEPKQLWVWLERRLINTADLVIACEPNRAQVMVDKYGAKTLPMTVLNVPPFQPMQRTTRIQEYLAERGMAGKKVAFYVGELKRGRCIDQFIEAAQQFPENVVLFLLGPIGEGYDVHAKIAACGVADRVVVHPPVKPFEVMDFACSAEVGLQAQIDDGLNHRFCAPIKLFQYLMAGLPVIASNFPGMIDVVERNEVGICVDPESVDEIAAGIIRLLGDDALWARMSANARRVAEEQYCYEKEGAKLLAAVDAMAKAPVERTA
jgi:glycosyltransferase involved in cell wall biosynthesis